MARVAPQHTDYGTQQRVTSAKSLEDLDLAKAYESCIPNTGRLKRRRSITGVSSHIIYHRGKVRFVVKTAVVPSKALIITHSTCMELDRWRAADGSPERSAGTNLSLFAAASTKSKPSSKVLTINARPYSVSISAARVLSDKLEHP